MKAAKISSIEEELVALSSYHNDYVIVDEDADDSLEDSDFVVVLS